MSVVIRRLLVAVAIAGALITSSSPSGATISNDPAGLTMIEPCVSLDTRAGTGSFAGPLQPGTANGMVFHPEGTAGISPQGGMTCSLGGSQMSAVVLSVEAVDVTTAGNLRVFATGEAAGGGVVNYGVPGSENSNVVIVPVRELDGTVTVEANVGAVQVVITVIGYFEPGTGADYTPVTPCTVADSRFGTGSFAGPYVGNTTKTIKIATAIPIAQGGTSLNCHVPITADGVLVNVVAANPTDDGSVGVRPPGSADSTTFVHYDVFSPAMNNAAAVFVPLSSTGYADLFTVAPAGASTHVRAVILGYVDAGSNGNEYVPVNACAAFDSRASQGASGSFAGAYAGGETRTVQVTGLLPAAQGGGATTCNVPAGARAVHLNLVAANPLIAGNLRVAAAGETPTGGVLNFAPIGTNNSNAIVVPLDADGRLDVSANAGPLGTAATTEARGVVLGYFLDVEQEIEVELLGPVESPIGTSIPSPFTISGEAFDNTSVVSVQLTITDLVTEAALIPVTYGSGIDWSSDATWAFDATLGSPGEASTSFSFGPIDLDAIGGSGNYRVFARATDNLGNVADAFMTIRTQISPGPTGTVEAPSANSSVSLPVNIAGTAIDPQGISSGSVVIRDVNSGLYLQQEPTGIQFVLGTANVPLVISGAQWFLQLDDQTLVGRSLRVEQLFLTDGAGNSSILPVQHRFSVTGDTTAPTVAIKSPSQGDTVTGPLTILGEASDTAGVTQVQVSIYNGKSEMYWNGVGYQATQFWLNADLGDEVGFSDLTWTYVAPSSLGTGDFRLDARAYDPPGNQADASTVVVTVT